MCWILWSNRISEIRNNSVSDILDSGHLPPVFHILELVTTTELSEPPEQFTDRKRFQSLASNFISPRIEINSGTETDKAAREFTASSASAYRLSTSQVKLDELNHDPGLDRLLEHKKRLRKLWQETRGPECKRALNRLSETITRKARKRAPKHWETKTANVQVASGNMTPGEVSHEQRWTKGTNCHSASFRTFHPSEKVHTTADSLEKQFTPRDVCDDSHKRQLEAGLGWTGLDWYSVD
jgi:hypothetical protein